MEAALHQQRSAAACVGATGLLSPELAGLLAALQEAQLYPDSKTAVDLVLKAPPAEVAARYHAALSAAAAPAPAAPAAARPEEGPSAAAAGTPDVPRRLSREALLQLVATSLAAAGSDVEPCVAPGWRAEPPHFLPHLQALAAAPAAAQSEAGSGTAAAGGSGGPTGVDATTTSTTSASSGISVSISADEAAELRAFGLKLNDLWGLLCRRVSPDVAAHPERHSLLPLPHPTFVPGDRFRETYYWDSYWVVLGLLACGMTQSALALVGNLLFLAELLGHVPNGARCYYTNRSQPPLLSAMVRAVYEASSSSSSNDGDDAGDAGKQQQQDAQQQEQEQQSSGLALLRRALPVLLAEHRYWTQPPKAVQLAAAAPAAAGPDAAAAVGPGPDAAGPGAAQLQQHCLSRYWADWAAPRPESYREDAALADEAAAAAAAAAAAGGGADAAGSSGDPTAAAAGEAARRRLYHELASAAESGWDFSSRWCADNASLATLRTTQVIPADLNAFLFMLERDVAWAAGVLGDAATRHTYEQAAQWRAAAMDALLWDEDAGMWRDGILQQQPASAAAAGAPPPGAPVVQQHTLTHSPHVFASNFVPLWAGLAAGDEARGARVVAALEASGLVGPAGIAASLHPTGQQWDWPNGWPPLQHMLIRGAATHGGPEGRAFAARMTHVWLRACMAQLRATGAMHEKYDVSQPGGGVGGGGEYAPQVGFGWSNGVALDLLGCTDWRRA